MSRPQQILFVSDDAPSELTRGAFEQRGLAVEFAQDFDTAYRQLHDSIFDLVIVDVAQASSGLEFVKRLRDTAKVRKTFVLTLADWGTGQATLALKLGADAYEPKPVSPERLLAAVDRLLRQKVVKTAAASVLE